MSSHFLKALRSKRTGCIDVLTPGARAVFLSKKKLQSVTGIIPCHSDLFLRKQTIVEPAKHMEAGEGYISLQEHLAETSIDVLWIIYIYNIYNV